MAISEHAHWVEPYGGTLQSLVKDAERAGVLKKISMELPEIKLTEHQVCDLELLAVGALSPLSGFMVRSDYESVIDRMRLQDGTVWPIPVCLDIPQITAGSLEAGQSVALRDPEGVLLAVMHISDIWPADLKKEARQVHGSLDMGHPGVHHLLREKQDYYVGGRLEVVSLPSHFDFRQLRLTPWEIRSAYRRLGWNRVIGFTTRNAIHRPQFEVTISAMRKIRANLLILPFTGKNPLEDFSHYTRVRCHKKVIRHYPPDAVLLNLLAHSMRMAGPKDAVLHAIIAKNFGCTHFIIGHAHATPINPATGEPYYNLEEQRPMIRQLCHEVGIEPVCFDKMVYRVDEDIYMPENEVEKEAHFTYLSAAQIRERIRTGRMIPQWAAFPEVIQEMKKAYPPPDMQGITLFLTGLPGAGKSTIAKVLYARFLEIGNRPVTLLDGDIVRHHLSSELSFSKEHRDINVRRIGFVASEITKNRGVAICAPIAPYAETRGEIRRMIEAYGGFIEVHVATPLEVCEKRDRKGMYAKAKAGLIKGFTGVDDPYETPQAPEVRVETSDRTPEESAQEILLYLGQKGYL